MPNLKEVRNRIVSVNSTKQITSAMKMVAAAKLKKAQDAIVQMRPYSEKLTEILSNLTASLDNTEGKYAAREGEAKNILFVAVTSNRGLCGAFNANILKAIRSEINSNYAGANVHVMSVGKKAHDFYSKSSYKIEEGASVPAEANYLFDNLEFDNVAPVAVKIMDAYVNGDYDKVVVVYNKFRNAASQDVTAEQFLPVVTEESDDNSGNDTDYIFEPSKKEILDEIIPKSLKTQFYKALLDSYASEHGARMTAMHKATDNASDLLKELKLSYNKARQAAITTEILEITSGAEALNS